MNPTWMKIKTLAADTNVSERTVRSWLKAGLRHSRLPTGTILVKREWRDKFLESHEIRINEVDRLVDETLRELS